jgi:hypothetical protein
MTGRNLKASLSRTCRESAMAIPHFGSPQRRAEYGMIGIESFPRVLLGTENPRDLRIFRTRDEALEWLASKGKGRHSSYVFGLPVLVDLVDLFVVHSFLFDGDLALHSLCKSLSKGCGRIVSMKKSSAKPI